MTNEFDVYQFCKFLSFYSQWGSNLIIHTFSLKCFSQYRKLCKKNISSGYVKNDIYYIFRQALTFGDIINAFDVLEHRQNNCPEPKELDWIKTHFHVILLNIFQQEQPYVQMHADIFKKEFESFEQNFEQYNYRYHANHICQSIVNYHGKISFQELNQLLINSFKQANICI